MGMAMPDEAGAYKQRKGVGCSWDVKKSKPSYSKTQMLLILGTFSPAIVGVCVRLAREYHNNRFLCWVALILYLWSLPDTESRIHVFDCVLYVFERTRYKWGIISSQLTVSL